MVEPIELRTESNHGPSIQLKELDYNWANHLFLRPRDFEKVLLLTSSHVSNFSIFFLVNWFPPVATLFCEAHLEEHLTYQ